MVAAYYVPIELQNPCLIQETDYAGRSWIENKAQSLSKKRWRFALCDVLKYTLEN